MKIDAALVSRIYEETLQECAARLGHVPAVPLVLHRDPGEVREGFHAEFYDDGQLAHLGYYKAGSREGTWALFLEPGHPRGRVQKVFTESYPEDADPGGHLAKDDDANALAYLMWVRGWITRIYEEYADAERRCAFCGKRRYEVARLFAGPGVYICSECVATCTDIMQRTDP